MNETTTAAASSALAGCLDASRRCRHLVEGLLAAAAGEALRAVSPHLRHCLDHTTCLLAGLPAGLVDYDARARDEELERQPQRLLAALAAAEDALASLPAGALGAEVRVRQTAAPDTPPVTLRSTVARELAFLSSHTIHHLAIAAMVAASHGAVVAPEITLAYSTAAHQARLAGRDR